MSDLRIRPSRAARRAAILLGLVAAAPITATVASAVTAVSPAAATTGAADRRPLCQNTYIAFPAVGESVAVRILDVAADPDRKPMRIESFFDEYPGSVRIDNNGTPRIASDDFLVFTRATADISRQTIYWTVSDGTQSVQCSSSGRVYTPPITA